MKITITHPVFLRACRAMDLNYARIVVHDSQLFATDGVVGLYSETGTDWTGEPLEFRLDRWPHYQTKKATIRLPFMPGTAYVANEQVVIEEKIATEMLTDRWTYHLVRVERANDTVKQIRDAFIKREVLTGTDSVVDPKLAAPIYKAIGYAHDMAVLEPIKHGNKLVHHLRCDKNALDVWIAPLNTEYCTNGEGGWYGLDRE